MMAPFLFSRDLLLVAVFMSFASKELLGVVLPPNENMDFGYPSSFNAAKEKEFDEEKSFNNYNYGYDSKNSNTFVLTSGLTVPTVPTDPTVPTVIPTSGLATSDITRPIKRKTTPPRLLKTLEPRTMEPSTMGPITIKPKTMKPKTIKPKTMEPTTMVPTVVATTLSPEVLDECNKICPEIVETPKCGSLRMAPQYEEKCRCLLKYVCCNETCPSVDNSICKGGESFPEMTTDCCDCPAIRCDACPSYKTPSCKFECEKIDFKVLENGCRIPVCKQSCPKIKAAICQDCYMVEAYVDGDFCGCTKERCILKPCLTKAKLPAKKCQEIKWSHDRCGCKLQKYDNSTYCDKLNKQAATHKCVDSLLSSSCFKNDLTKGTCGCKQANCIRVKEECQETFGGKQCPTKHYLQKGVTPCLLDREICLPCPRKTVCNLKCNTIGTSSDGNGCAIQTCNRKACPLFNPKCGSCEQLETESDDCGCLRPKCVRKCPTLSKVNCPTGTSAETISNDGCGCSRVICRWDGTVTEDGETWVLIQRRNNVGSSDGFDQGWAQYKNGFGNPDAYWLGLEKIYELTRNGNWQLLLKAKHTAGSYAGSWGKLVYDNFKIGNEASGYKLSFGTRLQKVNSGADNSLNFLDYHRDMMFTTKDKDNDIYSGKNCASIFGGGWWYMQCGVIALNDNTGLWQYDGASSQTLMAMRRTS